LVLNIYAIKMKTEKKNLAAIFISSIMFLMLLLIFVFLLLHKYAYNFEKINVEYSTSQMLNNTINKSIKQFHTVLNDSLSEVDFINKEILPQIKDDISNPMKAENAIVVVALTKTDKVVAISSDVNNNDWKNTTIVSRFSLYTNNVGTCYTCYYYIPDVKLLIIGKLKEAMIITICLILVFFVFFTFIIIRWRKSHQDSKLKDDFFQNITHELKTPIATTSIAIDIFKKINYSLPVDKTENYMNIISEENRKMKQIVDRLLSISIVDNSASKMSISDVNIHEILGRLSKNFDFVVTEKGGKIDQEYLAEKFIIRGDSSFVVMIFSNLIDNAIKYSPEAPFVKISTDSNEKGIYITVADKGIGMQKEALSKIFIKSYRIYNKFNIKGFGLGLYFVKQLVEIHQGNIMVNSKLGEGSEFVVFLPYKNKNK